jgi:hypothetical protein
MRGSRAAPGRLPAVPAGLRVLADRHAFPPTGRIGLPCSEATGDTVSMLTLSALLSQLLVVFMVSYEAAGGAALVVAEGLARGFGMKNTVPVTDLSPALGVESSGKSGLGRHGLLTVRLDPDDKSIKVAHLSPRGQRVRDALKPTLPATDPALLDALIATHVQS